MRLNNRSRYQEKEGRKIPQKPTLGQMSELIQQAKKGLFSREDVQKIIEQGRKRSLTQLFNKIIFEVAKIALSLPDNYQKARQLVRILEFTCTCTIPGHDLGIELKKVVKNCESWQKIEIETAFRSRTGVLLDRPIEKIWEDVTRISNTLPYRKIESLINIASMQNKRNEQLYFREALERSLSDLESLQKTTSHNLDQLRYKLILVLLKTCNAEDFERAKQLARKIEFEGTRDTALTEITIALLRYGHLNQSLALAKEIKHPFGRTKVFVAFYKDLSQEYHLKEAEKALTEIQYPFFKVRALAELAKVKSMIPFEEQIKIVPKMKELIPEIRNTKERNEALAIIALVSRRERDFIRALEAIPKSNDFYELDSLLTVATSIKEALK